MTKYKTSNAYDIATAFITDKNTTIKAHNSQGTINYTFIKYDLAEYPYCMTILAKYKAPKHKENNRGTIIVYRGTNISGMNNHRTLIRHVTKHEVGPALDVTKSDLQRFITRAKSAQFFNLLDLAAKRIANQLPTTDNSAQIYNMIYRMEQEKQK